MAVVVGVGISVILFVVQQSSRLIVKRMVIHDDGSIEEVDPPEELPGGEVVVVHPYGAIFFATTPALIAATLSRSGRRPGSGRSRIERYHAPVSDRPGAVS